MRKKLIALSIAVFLMILTAPALAAPVVLINNQPVAFNVEPIVENERVLVQMRPIFEALGASLTWDGPTQTVTAIKGATVIKLTIDNAIAFIDGSPTTLDVPARAIDGSTMVPLRFISEALGASVNYENGVVTIIPGPEEEGPPILTETPGHVDNVRVHFIDVGQADSIYIQLPGHDDILIDGGKEEDGSTVVNYLKSQNVDDIELMIATHPHEDHIGGLLAVFEAYEVEKVIDSGETANSQIFDAYSAAVAAEGCEYSEDKFQKSLWDKASLEILSYTSDSPDINDQSVVCKLTYGDTSFLFAGDTGAHELLVLNDLSADVVKIGYHGGDNSTAPDLIDLIKPSIAVISVGAGNIYGHPTPETLDNLKTAGIATYRTDQAGTIVVESNGISVHVQ